MEVLSKKLTSEEIDKISLVLAEAFYEDPVVNAFLQNEQEIQHFMQFITKYFNRFGEVHFVEDFSGAALWLPPGVPFLSIKNILQVKGMFKDFFYFLFSLSLRSRIILRKLSSFFSKNHLIDKHYYLFAIGVQSIKRDQGIGKLLMNFAISRFGEESLYYLENSNIRNLNFYQGFKFRVKSEGEFNGAKVFFMIREGI